jgi:pentapeptide MXKDX repeat protein
MNTRSHVLPIAAVLAVSAAFLLAPDSSAQDKMKDSMGKGDMMNKGEMKKDAMGEMNKDAAGGMKKDAMGGMKKDTMGEMKKDDKMKMNEMKK